MEWTDSMQLLVSVLIFAPGLILLGVFVVVYPLLGTRVLVKDGLEGLDCLEPTFDPVEAAAADDALVP